MSNGIAGLALPVAVLAVHYSRKATKASQDSAASARRSADVAERTERRQVEEAARQAVIWELTPEETQLAETYGLRLVNVGSEPAHDVRMTLPMNAQTVGRSEPQGETLQPGIPLSLEVALFRAVRDATLKLSWRVEPGQETQSRVYSFPY